MPSAVSKMNRNAAKLAATTEKLPQKDQKSILQLYVQIVATKQKYRLSRRPTDLFTAVTASQKQGNSNLGVS